VRGAFRVAAFAVIILLTATAYMQRKSAPASGGVFSHLSKTHQAIKTCSTCHTMPTSNWVAARGFPDVAQFPGHAACFSCHTSSVLTSNKPTFCLNCHTSVAPGRAPLLAFPIKTHKREFNIRFPHNTHQDIFARLFRNDGIAVAHYVNASSVAADEKTAINTCAVCHVESKAVPAVTPAPVKDGLVALSQPSGEKIEVAAKFFKTMPSGHQTCFACHYSGITPESSDCKSCHVPTEPYKNTDVLPRYSPKFDHTQEQHAGKDCMVCHVRIAQSADSRLLKDPDVPIIACLQCHNDPFDGKKPGADGYFKAAIQNEIFAREKDKAFQCTYCHSSAIGSYQLPSSHAILRKK
jgi:hypothetical protein